MMLSIVVCSVNSVLLNQLDINIKETIGLPYELIAIDNRNTSKGVCEVYNEGLDKAKYDIVCFCHEDIVYNTLNWGTELKWLLDKHNNLGLVGICGARYKASCPTPWVSVPQQYYRSNLVQKDFLETENYKPVLDSGDYSPVVVLDGCFIAGKRSVFQEYRWNDQLLKGFHLYDMELCFRVGKKYKLGVVNNFTITHLSEGSFDAKWLSDSEKVHAFYKNDLPIKRLVSSKEIAVLEYYALRSCIARLIKLKQSKTKTLKFIIELIYRFPFKRGNLNVIKLFVTQ